MIDKTVINIISRLERVEKAVFGDQGSRVKKPSQAHFRGATGGIRLLISKNFFDSKRALGNTRSALAQNGYHYSRQAVDMALKGLATRKGPLTLIKEGGRNLYVNRK